MNIANNLPAPFSPPQMPYNVPDPTELGEGIDQALGQQLEPMAAPEGAEKTVAAAALEGTSSADALAMEGVLSE